MISSLVFQKVFENLTIDDIETYFATEKKESTTLEFKSYNKKDSSPLEKKENNIIKSVAGLLNTEGGLIIWGAPAGHLNRDGEKTFSGQLGFVDQEIAEDKFMSRVASLITPTPTGIKFKRLQKNNSEYLYLLEVIKSPYAPHQYDGIYYMRLHSQIIKAPHHYVEALIKQIKIPDLNGYLFTNFETIAGGRHGIIPFVISIFNFSRFITAFNVRYSLIINYGNFFYEEENKNTTPNFLTDMDGRYSELNIATNTLQYDAPFTRRFFLVLPERYDFEEREFEIRLMFSSQESPMKISQYFFKTRSYPNNFQPQISLKEKNENKYTFELSDVQGRSDEQKVINTNNFLLNERLPIQFYKDGIMGELLK